MKYPPWWRLGFFILASWATIAWGHAPVVELQDASEEAPVRITWPLATSVAIYGYFESSEDVDVVSFALSESQLRKGREVYLHTLVPACKAYEDVLPIVALVGPLQASLPTDVGQTKLPFTLGKTEGVTLLFNEIQGRTWYEPFSGKNYFWQSDRTIVLTQAGEYRIYIWSPKQRRADYVLVVGNQERWGPREISRALKHMPMLLANNEIHDAECRDDLQSQPPSTNPLPSTN